MEDLPWWLLGGDTCNKSFITSCRIFEKKRKEKIWSITFRFMYITFFILIILSKESRGLVEEQIGGAAALGLVGRCPSICPGPRFSAI